LLKEAAGGDIGTAKDVPQILNELRGIPAMAVAEQVDWDATTQQEVLDVSSTLLHPHPV
jgi:hypothetical protein